MICAVQLGDTTWTTYPSPLAAWNEPSLGSPVGESRLQCCEATCNPSAIPLKPVWDPSVERQCWKCPSTFPSHAIFCCLQGKDQQAAKLLPPVFASFSSPLVSLCQTCRGQGAVKILQRGRDNQTQMNFSVHTSACTALALQLLTKAPCNDPSFILSLALGERIDLSSLKQFTAKHQGQEHDFHSLSKQSGQGQGKTVQMKQARGSTGCKETRPRQWSEVLHQVRGTSCPTLIQPSQVLWLRFTENNHSLFVFLLQLKEAFSAGPWQC